MKIKKYDILLAAAVLLLAGLMWLLLRPGDGGAWVVVTRSGEEVARYALDEDRCVTLGGEDFNVLEICGGAAAVTEANCGDRTCVRMGRISRTGETVICLPHELVIEITGVEQADYDAVTG